jgi:putative phage-type endonuclease
LPLRQEDTKRRPLVNREKFLKERLTGVGGSDASAILGEDPRRGLGELTLEKRGLTEPIPDNDAMSFGRDLEPVLRARYLAAHRGEGIRVRRPVGMSRHLEKPFMIAHLDYVVSNRVGQPLRGLECKTTGWRGVQDWGEEGTDEVPFRHLIQCQHYMAVTGLPRFDVAVFLDRHYAEYTVERSEAIIAGLVEKETEFWTRYVLGNDLPPVTFAKDAAAYLKALWPESKSPPMQSTPEIDVLIAKLAVARAELERADDAEARAQVALQAIMGDAEALVGEWGKVSWKSYPRKTTGWKEIAEYLKAPPELIEAHTETKPVRPFRLTLNEKE